MATQFTLNVITPDKQVFSEKVQSVVLPGVVGEFGVLSGHAPFFSVLKIGAVKVLSEAGGTAEYLAISGGYAEVRSDEVTVLAPSAERAEDIDVARAQAALERAEERIAAQAADVDLARAQTALARALNRLAVAGHHQS